MAILSTDIVIYGSTNMQVDDASSPQGGAINTTVKMTFTDMSGANSPVNLVSDNAADSGTVVVTGRSAGGSLVTDNISLLGTTVASGSQIFERIIRIYESGHVGILTASSQDEAYELATLPSSVYEVRRPFYTVTGEASGGSAVNVYEKVFIKNESATSDLLSATVGESSDGTESPGADITFDLASGLDDTATSTNRITAPASGDLLGGTFDDTLKSVPGGSLPFGNAIGVWMKLNIPAGTVPTNTTFVFDVSGAST